MEGFCRTRELAVKNESIEDTFKDIAVYSTLAMILFRKQQDDATQELTEIERGKGKSHYDFSEPVDDKYNGDESFTHPMIAMREAAEKQQEEEDTENLREALQLQEKRKEEERSNVKILQDKLEAQRQGHLRSKENVSHIQSIQRDANNN